MATDEHSAQFDAVNPSVQHHVCAFFGSMDEEHRVLRPFYRDGFDRGEKATHIVAAENRDPYLKRLAEAGIDVKRMMDTGKLEVLRCTDLCGRNTTSSWPIVTILFTSIPASASRFKYGSRFSA